MKWNKFICPIDGQSTLLNGGSLRCENGHTYDIAREGYCNLLLVQQKASLEPGDSSEMVIARRRFLEGGFYLPLAKRVSALVAEQSKSEKEYRVLDAGCGDGYYLRHIHHQNPTFELIGIDISKPAVRAAAKLSPSLSWAVASNKLLPVEPASVDLILSMFGFPLWDSFAKVQKPRGHVILVDPGENHLIELREIIYPSVNKSKVREITPALEHGYRLVSEEALNFSFELKTQTQIADLLLMTPHAFRMNQLGSSRLAEIKHLKLTVDLSIRTLQLG